MPLARKETKIIGTWRLEGDRVVRDAACGRIELLIASELDEVGANDSASLVLYQDPTDGRYWELSYPDGETHGDGPPVLTCISAEEAARDYNLAYTPPS